MTEKDCILIALFLLTLSNIGFAKTHNDICLQPIQYKTLHLFYTIFGNISGITLIATIVFMFYIFDIQSTILLILVIVTIGIIIANKMYYLGATFVVFAYPFGLTFLLFALKQFYF